MKCTKCDYGLYYDAANTAYVCRYCNGRGVTEYKIGGTTYDSRSGEPISIQVVPLPTPCVDTEGRLIRAAGDVMRAQRLKGIAKYESTLEDQHGYNLVGMIDMAAEELADGAVYVQKLREMHLALLDELAAALHNGNPYAAVQNAEAIINRERNRA